MGNVLRFEIVFLVHDLSLSGRTELESTAKRASSHLCQFTISG